MNKLFLIFSFILLTGNVLPAQRSTFNGWFFSSHEQKLTPKWSILSDIQIRSADKLKYIETILLRPAIQFEISKMHSTAVGYTYFASWKKMEDDKIFEPEHRVWEQYNLQFKLGLVIGRERIR